MNKEQLEYVQTQFDNGISPDDLRAVMHEAGYDDELIAKLFAAVKNQALTSTAKRDGGEVQHTSAPTEDTGQLPSFNEFIQKAWTPSLPLLQLAVVGVVGWAVATAMLLTFSDNYIVQSLSGWMAALTGLISLYLLAAIVAIVLRADCVSVSDGLKWANKNFASIWWLGIVMFLVQMTGLMFLLIPGLVIMAYIALSYPVRVVEGKKGIQAMVRSTALVHGQWWSVFGRLVLLGLTFVPLLIIAFITSTLFSTWFNLDAKSVWVAVPFWIVNAIVLAIYANAISILYTHLSIARDYSAKSNHSIRILYIIFAIIAPFILLELQSTILSSFNDARSSAQEARVSMVLISARADAEIYYSMNNETYDGACADITSEITCESTADSYRLSAPAAERFACVDSVENEIVTVVSLPNDSLRCM